MPKHRQETKQFEKVAGGIIVGAVGVTATLLAFYKHSDHSQVDETVCSVVPNLPKDIPDEDTNETVILNNLHISRDQMNLVEGYAATCHTSLSSKQFSEGIPADPTTYNKFFGTSYDRCTVYSVPIQLIPTTGDRTTPAVLACIDLPNKNENLIQI
jgi:lantibiotic modifying enzyme